MMSTASDMKIDGRPTYQQKYSISPDRKSQVNNEYGESNDSADHNEIYQLKVQHGSPQASKKTVFTTPEKVEALEKDFLTTPDEEPSTTKEFLITFNGCTSFKGSSTAFKDTLATYEGTSKDPSTSQSNLTNLKDVAPKYKSSCKTYKTSRTYSRSVTTHNLPKNNKQPSVAYMSESPNLTKANLGVGWLISLVLIIAVVAVAYAVPKAFPSDQNVPFSKKNCTFDSLKSKYQNQDTMLWKSLRVQIEGILNQDPAVPSVFLFLFTSLGTEELVWNIAKTTSACFDPSLEPMKLDKKDFTQQASIVDYGVIINKYKEQVADGGALVVTNLNEIPGKAARALHAICDTYNPIIDRVVIFMTLRVKNEVGNPIEVAENTLNEIWGTSLARHELDPLITRVTEEVFYLSN